MTAQSPIIFTGELAEGAGPRLREGLRGLSGRMMTTHESELRQSEGLCFAAFADFVAGIFSV